MPVDIDSREKNLARLREAPLDVLIIGGGINGAGIARDLALRNRRARSNLRIGLVEQRHFASGTSGRNSQLIHGGLRYLKRLELGLVSEALRERATVLEIAPHLAHPQPFRSRCIASPSSSITEPGCGSMTRWQASGRSAGIVR